MSGQANAPNKMLEYLGVTEFGPATLARELMASVVVFLVALPLCMGIAIASGVPPALGLLTGIVGGLVVGFFAGCRLQVSGPAAGLAVIVWDLVQTHGLAMLGVIVLLAGGIQLLAGVLKLGQWFRAVSPAVVRGMLAGIGVLIFASQFHVMVDDKPRGDGVTNLLTIPESVYKGIFPADGSPHQMAAIAGLVTLAVLVGWNVLRPEKLKMVPGALLGVIAGSGLAAIMGFQIKFVSAPESLAASANWLPVSELGRIVEPSILVAGLTLAVIASAETLLCATAVDALHDGPRTKYDQELISQGIGNLVCGVLGALPMTGVIVRSSANVDAGAKTRLSTIFHGAWLLIFVALLPFILQLIPTASLAAILVFTGYKLMNPKAVIEMWKFNKAEGLIFTVTVVGIVATNLLAGILMGIAVALVRLALRLAKLDVEVEEHEDEGVVLLHLRGNATFLTLPKLAKVLEALPGGIEVRVELVELGYIDHACIELFKTWESSREAQGNTLVLGWDHLFSRYEQALHPETTVISFTRPDDKPDPANDDAHEAPMAA